MELRRYLRSRGALVNGYLQVRLGVGSISPVDKAMMYSVAAGGKRLRPILLMAAADAVGAKGSDFVAVAAGLEMIHTYSLIHDDLPSMDNDDYRRGRLTNHKVFGDAMALLAGDGLLTQAFEVMLEQRGVHYYWSWLPAKVGYDIYDEGAAVFSRAPITAAENLLPAIQRLLASSESLDQSIAQINGTLCRSHMQCLNFQLFTHYIPPFRRNILCYVLHI